MLSQLFIFCAAFGGTILCVQFLFACFGIGFGSDTDMGEVDLDIDADSETGPGLDMHDSAHHHTAIQLFKILSFRTLIAGMTFFGLGGMIGISGGLGPILSSGIACLLGIVAVFGVYYLYKSLSYFQSEGNLSKKTLQWATGEVYLRIPGNGDGRGKVQVLHQNRTMEYEATTPGPELLAGTPIIVTKVVSDRVVEVKHADR
ncbi:MAG TPA: hypothetical protein DEB39_04785 [Planctomycetaceae bacterium]|nr:hypothetical protein [Planctomycetaceae bacterium]